MPAIPSDIAAALRQQIVVSTQDVSIKGRFPSARDGSAEPAEGFFDSSADASTALAQRATLLGTLRRRFAVVVADLIDVPGGTVPTHRLIDSEQGVDASVLVSRIEVDLENEQSKVEYFG